MSQSRAPQLRSPYAGLRTQIELTHSEIGILHLLLLQARVDKLAEILEEAYPTPDKYPAHRGGLVFENTPESREGLSSMLKSLGDRLDFLDCWLTEHTLWIARKPPYDGVET